MHKPSVREYNVLHGGEDQDPLHVSLNLFDIAGRKSVLLLSPLQSLHFHAQSADYFETGVLYKSCNIKK